MRLFLGCASLATLAMLFWFNEFTSPDGEMSAAFVDFFAGIRVVDVVVAAVVAIPMLILLAKGNDWLVVPRGVKRAGSLFLVAIACSLAYGWLHHGTHMFFEWKEICIGVALVLAFSYWIRTRRELKTAVAVFAGLIALRALYILAVYALGGGVDRVILHVRTPYYDGPTISAAGLMGLLGLRFYSTAVSLSRRLFWMGTGLLGYGFVIACFRRSNWGELFIATAILLLWDRHGRGRKIILISFAMGTMLLISGHRIYERIINLSPTSTDRRYAETNIDHINDVLDALDQIQQHPITGIGLGRSYQTWRIAKWKTESWGVHNGPVHVWLIYGLLGLVAYLWFHVALFRSLKGFVKELRGDTQGFAQVCFAYFVGQFVMTLGFTPWPYGSLHAVIVISLLLGSLLGVLTAERRQRPNLLPAAA